MAGQLGINDAFLSRETRTRRGRPRVVTTAAETPVPAEETLACGDDGSAVVLVSTEGGRCQLYQYRRAGAVVAEAPTLRLLAELIGPTS